VGKMPPALPLLQQDLGLNLREVGWVVSLFSTIATLCAAGMGLLSGRVGAWRFTLVGLCALVAGGLLGAVSDSYAVLLASRILEVKDGQVIDFHGTYEEYLTSQGIQ